MKKITGILIAVGLFCATFYIIKEVSPSEDGARAEPKMTSKQSATRTVVAPKVHHTPYDRDIMIRTVIGEAWHGQPSRRQPRLGMRAVAHVIINRVRDGRFGGNTLSKVCLAKYQFEPWISRRKALMRISRNSQAYKHVAAIVDPILDGRDLDPTNGALFFLNPITVRKRRRRGDLPRWAVGKTLTVTASNPAMVHVFYKGPQVAGWFRTLDDLVNLE